MPNHFKLPPQELTTEGKIYSTQLGKSVSKLLTEAPSPVFHIDYTTEIEKKIRDLYTDVRDYPLIIKDLKMVLNLLTKEKPDQQKTLTSSFFHEAHHNK